MQIPFIDLKRENIDIDNLISHYSEIIHNKSFSASDYVSDLDNQLCNILDVKYTLSCANGTDALQIALRSAGIGANDKVIIPDLTFWATFESVINVGAEPIIVDIECDSFAFDCNLLETAIKKHNPKCIILVNLYGICSLFIKDIASICKKYNVLLIADNAQAFKVKIDCKSIFSFFDISTTSFYPAKVLGASGDAGAIFFSKKEFFENAKKIANHGRKSHYEYDFVGFNSRIDSINALYLLERLKNIDNAINERLHAIKQYYEIRSIKIFKTPQNISSNGYLNISLANDLKERENLELILKENNIGYGRVYPSTISSQLPAKNYSKLLNGNAEKICNTIVNLPVFPGIHTNEIDYVIDKVNQL